MANRIKACHVFVVLAQNPLILFMSPFRIHFLNRTICAFSSATVKPIREILLSLEDNTNLVYL